MGKNFQDIAISEHYSPPSKPALRATAERVAKGNVYIGSCVLGSSAPAHFFLSSDPTVLHVFSYRVAAWVYP